MHTSAKLLLADEKALSGLHAGCGTRYIKPGGLDTTRGQRQVAGVAGVLLEDRGC